MVEIHKISEEDLVDNEIYEVKCCSTLEDGVAAIIKKRNGSLLAIRIKNCFSLPPLFQMVGGKIETWPDPKKDLLPQLHR